MKIALFRALGGTETGEGDELEKKKKNKPEMMEQESLELQQTTKMLTAKVN